MAGFIHFESILDDKYGEDIDIDENYSQVSDSSIIED